MSKIGDVEFSIIPEENVTYRNTITQKPIESKEDISEHIVHQPYKSSFDFYLIGDDALDRKIELEKMAQRTEVYEYFDAKELTRYRNIAIQELSWKNNKDVDNGFYGRMTIKKIKIVENELIEIETGSDPATGDKVQEKSSDDETKPTTTERPRNIPGPNVGEDETTEEPSLFNEMIYGGE